MVCMNDDAPNTVTPLVTIRVCHPCDWTERQAQLTEVPNHLFPEHSMRDPESLIDDAIASGQPVSIVTYSETVVLRARRRIVEDKLPFLALRLLIDLFEGGLSRWKFVAVNSNGEIDWWPDGLFKADLYEVYAIQRAIRAREAAAAKS